jgi:hypothetical protein
VQDWLTSRTGGRIQALLPLVFHPLSMVRRATAIFLAPLVFLPACRLADDTIPHHVTTSNATADLSRVKLQLYTLFTSSHYLPLQHVELNLPPRGAASGGAQPGKSAAAELLEEQSNGKTHMVGLLIGLGKLTAAAKVRASPDEWYSLSSRCSQMCKLLDCLPGA